MNCIYRLHAIERMFERDISDSDVKRVIKLGEIIETYVNDKPYTSYLNLGYVDNRALHVVYAEDEQNNVIVITVYEPSLVKWKTNFKQRIK